MHTGSRPKEWNATGDLGTNHSVPAHTKRGCPNDPAGMDLRRWAAFEWQQQQLGAQTPIDLGQPGGAEQRHVQDEAATPHRGHPAGEFHPGGHADDHRGRHEIGAGLHV